MTSNKEPLTVGYVAGHLKTYYAEEYNLFVDSIDRLGRLGDELGFRLVAAKEAVVSGSEARVQVERLKSEGVDFLLVHHATFVMGDVIKELAGHGIPLGLWAHPEPETEGGILLNGFVSLDMSASIIKRYLRDKRIGYKWFYGDPAHTWLRDRLALTVNALRARKALASGTVGLVGGIAPTFYNFAFDERVIKDELGISVVQHELGEIFARVRGIDPGRNQAIRNAITERTDGRVTISDRDFEMTAAIYAALSDFAAEQQCEALAVSDWPAFQSELDIHPGFAFSWLEDQDRVPVASEGDVLGAATQLLMNATAANQTFLLDMAAIDTASDAVLMWHCGGSPLSLADDSGVQCINHSTLGRKVPNGRVTGAVSDLVFRHGPVTVGRLSDDGRSVFCFEADVIPAKSRGYDGCRGWISSFSVDGQNVQLGDIVNTVLSDGLEHHFGLVAGTHGAALREWAYWSGIRRVPISPYSDGAG